MDIKDKFTPQEKGQIASLVIECQVLESLLKERSAILQKKANDILARNGLSPQLYDLKVNPSQDIWEAELKEGALVVPNREMRRAIERLKN